MSLYTRARRHVDMNRVKELREEKIKKEEIVEVHRQQEEILAELKLIEIKENPKYCNWRRDLSEGMTTSDVFSLEYPGQGDIDLIDYDFDGANFDPSDDVNTGAGTGSGYQGGFPLESGRSDVAQIGGESEYFSTYTTTQQDLSTFDSLSVTAIAGNDTNGGITPSSGLIVSFFDDNNISEEIPLISASDSSYTNVTVSIPEQFRKSGVRISIYTQTYERINDMNLSGRHWGHMYFNVSGLDYTNIRNIFPNEAGQPDAHGEDFIQFYLNRPKTDANMKSLGHYYWYNVNAQRFGLVDTDRSGSEGGWWWAQWPSPPINPERTYGDSGNNYVGGPRDEDYIRIGELIYDQFKGTKLYGIGKISLKRRSTMNVFVGLDDPEAAAFVRDGDFDRLSPAEKKRRLEEQLRSSNEYLNKMFGEGMPKGATEISDVQPQQSFADIAQGLPYTDEDDAFDDPYYNGPPPDLDDDSDFNPDDFEYAANQGPSTPVKYDKDMDQLVPNPGGGRPGKIRLKGKAKMFAHHEPQGKVLTEKKRLKSPKELVNKIPGYYDGKPSPLGFPVEEPPKMKNGFHPDLVDGKKVANRFNRLDPISAKSMPPTGNPHIDKKVRKASKKPK